MTDNMQLPEEQDQNRDPQKKKDEESEAGKGKYKSYSEDDSVNEDMKAGNPTGVGENEEAHWSDEDDDEKPRLP